MYWGQKKTPADSFSDKSELLIAMNTVTVHIIQVKKKKQPRKKQIKTNKTTTLLIFKSTKASIPVSNIDHARIFFSWIIKNIQEVKLNI